MRLLLVVLLVLNLFLPVMAVETPYVAVYTSPNIKHCWKKFKHPLDMLWSTDSWSDFDRFLAEVHRQAKGKLIVLDMCVHGDKQGLLSKTHSNNRTDPNYFASFGFALNHIERGLAGDRVCLIFDTCFGSYCYRSTVKGNFPVQSKYYFIENHTKPVTYPVYGGGYSSNWATLLLEEYLHSLQGRKPIFLRDLRLSLGESKGPTDDHTTLEAAQLDLLRKLDNKP